jgi:chemotaxis protein CheC
MGRAATTLMQILVRDSESGTDMDAMKSGALTEVGNIVLNSLMGSIVNLIQQRLEFVVPFYSEDTPSNIIRAMTGSDEASHLIMAKTSFQIERNAVEGCIIIVFEIAFMSKLAEAFHMGSVRPVLSGSKKSFSVSRALPGKTPSITAGLGITRPDEYPPR